jgi:hypothetical protein
MFWQVSGALPTLIAPPGIARAHLARRCFGTLSSVNAVAAQHETVSLPNQSKVGLVVSRKLARDIAH